LSWSAGQIFAAALRRFSAAMRRSRGRPWRPNGAIAYYEVAARHAATVLVRLLPFLHHTDD
jgi:hypothetical protein